MNKKSIYFFYSLFAFVAVICAEVVYLQFTKSMSSEMLDAKLAFVKVAGLPDLAISTEANYVRHRSMSDIFSIYKDDGSLREYFPSTYVYSHSHIINKKSLYEK